MVWLPQWVPPHERARAVSLATSGMYLGSAGAMLALPALAAWRGPGRVLQFNAGLGFLWLAAWVLIGRDVPHRHAWTLSWVCACMLILACGMSAMEQCRQPSLEASSRS